MRKEINSSDLQKVAGGRYFINTDKKLVVFQHVDGVFNLKCKPSQAMDAMDDLIGKYATEEEYDEACVEMLRNNGWI